MCYCRTPCRRGYQTRLAHSGTPALNFLEAETFDLVISDLRMSGMNGQQLHDQLAAQKHSMVSRIAFVIGDAMEASHQALLRRTGCLWLDKPFKAATFGLFLEEVRAKLRSGPAEYGIPE